MSIRPDPASFDAPQAFLDGRVTLWRGDCLDVLRRIPDGTYDSIVTDPPYALVSIVKRFGKAASAPAKGGASGVYMRASAGFMGKQWDTGERAFAVEFWAEALRILKPGGHVAAFSGTRTYHRLAVAIEDAGFEIRDQLAWAYSSGFPASHDVSKAIDKARGAAREVVKVTTVRNPKAIGGGKDGMDGAARLRLEAALERGYHETAGDNPATPEAAKWQGWGTALKPAWEPIVLARKPLCGTVAENVLQHGTGAINVDGCRTVTEERIANHGHSAASGRGKGVFGDFAGIDPHQTFGQMMGRFPANLLHDGSPEIVALFPDSKSTQGQPRSAASGDGWGMTETGAEYADSGSAARFFYAAKADAHDRIGSGHPTVKPVDLMQWLCRLITPPGGLVLDPFAGTGTTGEAAWREGFACHLVEREADYCADIARRMALAAAGPQTRKTESLKAKSARRGQEPDHGPLFGGVDTPPVTGGRSMENSHPKAGAEVEPNHD